jgi:predicted GNAT family acetyltransferase
VPFVFEDSRLAYIENGRRLAEVTFPDTPDGLVDVDHTFVDDSLRGRGIAGQLKERVAAKLREDGRRAKLSCSYAKSWFEKHGEYSDLIADA